MLLATWNVNSIKSRKDRLLQWLQKQRPDVVCLQELKSTEEDFPYENLRQAGYHCAVHGQKTWNGVAILARTEPRQIVRGFEDATEDTQSRLLAATVGGIRVLSAYVPNGATVGSDKYAFKLAWLARLREKLRREVAGPYPVVVAGDFNIAPSAEDVVLPQRWEGSVLFNPEVRSIFADLLTLGLVDVPRPHLPPGTCSWWDYRQLSFPRNNGLRIDHLLATPDLASRCTEAWIDRDERKGKQPSDHAPVLARFTI